MDRSRFHDPDQLHGAINHPLIHRKQRWITASSAGALLVIALAGLGSTIAGVA
ncbi:hypothetical protein CFB34_038940 [Burkholderia sp. HI4860]|uniref:hypothetical protein n=1 Tax=Burkholderia sp. HI4860 TaxID=2015361 RepID=UPI001F6003A4|nr:hypothetical protein [Burkholderia sp. HI4860]MCI3974960.1 hypothetical protein [Burkholderia sp. HI4860]